MPEFSPSELKAAKVTMSNPTGKAFDYLVDLYMGTNLTLMAEIPFHLNAYEAKDISLPVTMPSAIGTYPVYIGVFSNSQFIEPLYKAVEDVVIVAVAEFAYVSDVRYFMVGVDSYGAIIQHGEIDIKNISDVPGVCSVELYWQIYIPMAGDWSGFRKGLGREPGYYELDYRYLLSATLQPGETKTFFDEFDYSSFANKVQIYFIGSPGKSPTKEFPAITD